MRNFQEMPVTEMSDLMPKNADDFQGVQLAQNRL